MDVKHYFACLILCICPLRIVCNEKRLVMEGATGTEERLQALELIVQRLKAQISQLENINHNQLVRIESLETKDRNCTCVVVNSPKQGCQTGTHNLDDSQGHAHAKSAYITFNPQFSEVPKIVWGTTGLDVDHSTNIRYRTSVKGLSANGFTISASTWDDTSLYHVGIQWMACPAHYQ